jgi:hypothetical protein
MAPCHPGSGKPHHITRLLALPRFVTVNRAVGTGWFFFAVWALIEPPFSVAHQFGTIIAQAVTLQTMVVIAVNFRHANERFVFSLQSSA